MLTEEIKGNINRSVLCWLATVSEKGIPNVSPKEVFTFYGDSGLLIANVASPQSIRNIAENENVCVSFIDIFVQKGYQLKGTAKVIRKTDPEYDTLASPLADIAGDKIPIASVIQILATSAKPIIAPGYILYPGTREGEQIASAMKTYKVQPI